MIVRISRVQSRSLGELDEGLIGPIQLRQSQAQVRAQNRIGRREVDCFAKFSSSLGNVAELGKRDPKISVGLGMVRIQTQGSGEFRRGFHRLGLVQKDQTENVMGFGITGVESY